MAYLEKYGFLQIDWADHRDSLPGLAPAARDPRCEPLILDWLQALGRHLGDGFSLVDNEDFIYFTYLDTKTARQRLAKMTETGRLVEGSFRLEPAGEGRGRLLVVELDTLDEYYDYLTHFFEQEEAGPEEELIEAPMSGGCMVAIEYPQIVLNHFAKGALTRVFATELMKLRIADGRLPLWLNEGLAANAEALATGQARYGIGPHNKDYHDGYWTADSLADFWAGRTFLDEKGYHLSFDLAYMVTQNLLNSGLDLAGLLAACRRAADPADPAGFRQATGVNPADFLPHYIRGLVGPGV
jgi:hypothetical protein